MPQLRDIAESRGPSTLVFNPNMIEECEKYNTRDMESESTQRHIREMADAIKANGNEKFPPITITQEGDHIYVVSGWCRRRAHVLAMQEEAPIKGILCLNAGKLTQEDVTLSILTSNDGLSLTSLEKAEAVRRLTSFLWTVEDVAKKTGWSESTVRNLLALYDAPEEIKEKVASGEISTTLATQVIKENAGNPEVAVQKIEAATREAKSKGKGRATQSDMGGPKPKNINWKVYGPKVFKLLSDIYSCPVTDRDKMMQAIACAGDILAEIEDKQGGINAGKEG